MSLKRDGKGNPPEDVRAERRGEEEDKARSLRNVTPPQQFKRGGKVRKTGRAILHAGERVIPAGKVRRVERLMKRAKMRKTDRSRR